MTERPMPTGRTIIDSVKFVKPGDPDYPYALAHELSHHTLKGPDGKQHQIRGIVKNIPTITNKDS